MLERYMTQGRADALRRLGLAKHASSPLPGPAAPAPTPAAGGMMGRAKAFGAGQLDAGKDLLSNLRGGLGGKLNPDVLPAPGGDLGATRSAHRERAIGNLKTLAPSLLAGGGLYMLHQHHQQAEEQRRQQAMQSGYSQPMM